MIFNDILLKNDGMIKGPFGSAVKKSLFVPKGDNTYKVYEQSVVSNNDYSKGNYYLPKDYVDGSLRRFMIQPGDILMTGAGTLGLLSIVPDSIEPGIMNQALIRVRLNEKVIYKPYFMYYFPWAIKKVATRINGDSVIPNLPPLDVLKKIEINIPSLDEQKLIADSLAIVDSKILNNGAICTELEAMSRTLYDYWFVQFDFPDENGKPYKSSGGKMVWNEELKREIPEGWIVRQLSDISSLQQNSVFPSAGTKYSHYSIPAFDEMKMPSLEDGAVIASNKYLVPNESVLVSKLNPQFKRIWLILQAQDNAICSTEFLPVKATETGIYYLYSLLNAEAFSVHLKQKASSSTGSRKRIDPENVMAFQFAFDKAIAENYNHIVSSWIEGANRRPIENQQLVSLRDFLLPMLMNGQVKVN